MEWKDATAFITGGASGIGLGIARSLARRQVRLALVDIDRAALGAAKAELEGITPVETHALDVRDRKAYAAAADAVEQALGPVTLLFNNAGIAPAVPVADMQYQHWEAASGINIDGVYNGIQTFVPRMIRRGDGGYVVNTASAGGLFAGANWLYTTTKFAVVGLSEALKIDLARYGIDVSVLCPGPVDTNLIATSQALGDSGATRDDEAAYLRSGTSIDAVGEMVVAGMERRATWIHTDGVMRPYVAQRMEALLASIPQDGPPQATST